MSEPFHYKILIVDDSKVNRILLRKLLQETGYDVLEAENGFIGREVAFREQPDLILLDIQMPVEDGFETIGRLKINPHTAQIPVIFLSGLSAVSSKVEGLERGAVDFITKPFDPAEVRARVKVHLKLSVGIKALVENQRVKLEQLSSAQQQMLVRPEDIPGANFYARYIPLSDAGGDFYSVIELNADQYGYFLGDVSGHDISTSYITAALNALLLQNCTALNTSAEAMSMINKVLCQTLESHKFLAATYLHLNRVAMKATLINMGNPPLLYIDNKGESRIIISKGSVLGIFEDALFSEYEFEVSKGDKIIMFSDGILESSGDVWSAYMDDLIQAAKAMRGGDLKGSVGKLCDYFVSEGTEITDDIAILALEV